MNDLKRLTTFTTTYTYLPFRFFVRAEDSNVESTIFNTFTSYGSAERHHRE